MKNTLALGRTLALLVSPVAIAAESSAQATPLITQRICAPGIDDAAGQAGCIHASSVPKEGHLYPLGKNLFVDTTGFVGLGTKTPDVRLDLKGSSGSGSSMRLRNSGSSGSGGIVFERTAGTVADWKIGPDPDALSADFVLTDNIAATTPLRIDSSGQTHLERLRVGDSITNAGALIIPTPTGVNFSLDEIGFGVGTFMHADGDEVTFFDDVTMGDVRIRQHGSLTFQALGTQPDPPMIEMFEGGTSNFDRMVLAHSETYEDWGLRYDDASDAFHFVGGGNAVLSIDLRTSSGKVGIEVDNPTNILHIQQGAVADPIADRWTTYSSRRWKENIQPIVGALDMVRQLRGVTYDWKESGEHDLGMIAEEVGEIVPEVVAYEENGVDAQSVDYARLSALLVEAVKEQDAVIAEQGEQLREQALLLRDLAARVAQLEDRRPAGDVR